MKGLYVLLALLLFSLHEANTPCESDPKPEKNDQCKDREKGADERCCYKYEKYYEGGTMKEHKFCQIFKKDEFDNFPKIYKSRKNGITSNGGSVDTLEWYCSSNYLFISLLSLMVLLL